MKLFSRIFGRSSRTPEADMAAIAALLGSQDLRDRSEARTFRDLPRITKVIELSTTDVPRCITLCSEQLVDTPDCDIPYSWLGTLYMKADRPLNALAVLHDGLLKCKRVSGLLKTMGRYFLNQGSPGFCLQCFTKAILAQEPARKDADPYLYLSYIWRALEMGNAADGALRVVDSSPMPERLDGALQHQIISVFRNEVGHLQPLARSSIARMLEEGRLG